MEEKSLYTITVFSENHVGLLSQISNIFTRRCLNIESISASASSIAGVHKMTLTCCASRRALEKVVAQIEKRIDVLKAFLYSDKDIVYQEVALYKVPTKMLLEEKNLEQIIRRHGARILDITDLYTVVEKTGHSDETESLFNELRRYGITQFVRSGRVAVTKSPVEYVTNYLAEQEIRRREEN